MTRAHRGSMPESERAGIQRLVYTFGAMVVAAGAPVAAVVSPWLVLLPLCVAALLALCAWYTGLPE